jgi:integrase
MTSTTGTTGFFDVRVWAVSTYRGQRGATYTVRWAVDGQRHQDTFATRKLADSFRAQLLTATRQGSAFDRATGLPVTLLRTARVVTWYEQAATFMDAKWQQAAPTHRRSLAEALITLTTALVTDHRNAPDPAVVRHALRAWAFNSGARERVSIHDAPTPQGLTAPLRWIAQHSRPLEDLTSPRVIRQALQAIGENLDGKPASPSAVRRRRSAFHSALDHAVDLGLIAANPLSQMRSHRTATPTEAIDRRVVVNPSQARALLGAIRDHNPDLEAWFGCLYYAALRPAEARHLRVLDCDLPESGWGQLTLTGSTQSAGSAWTDDGRVEEDRALKHRHRTEARIVPASPELVALLTRHISAFPPGKDGRLFVARTGRAGIPLPPPLTKPISMGVIYRAWDHARRAALTASEYASPLARRPYDLRHAAVSLWLNAGVPPTQVAAWAGHGVDVLLRVYASCVVGQERQARDRIARALEDTRGPEL